MKIPKISLLSLKAAERVKKLFTKENQNFFYTLTKQLPSHHYDRLMVPKVPPQLRRLSFYGNKFKTPIKKQRHWNSKQKDSGKALDLKDMPYSNKDLNPLRVKLCKLKEHNLASRKLKTISLQKKGENSLKNQVSHLTEQDPQHFVKDERMEYWEDFIKNREERHFNIGRIIKYLSD